MLKRNKGNPMSVTAIRLAGLAQPSEPSATNPPTPRFCYGHRPFETLENMQDQWGTDNELYLPFLFAGAVLAMSAPVAAAQGNYSAALRTILTRTATGTCPSDMMQPKLLKACKQQISKMGPPLTKKGPIKKLTLLKADLAGGREETYVVTFEKGTPQTWLIGGLKDGSFSGL